jgi:hypothetical protein
MGGACGKCGCGMPETDTDTDGVPDCIDMCMGVSDADCAVLKSGLRHRYSFGGTGTAVTDTKGTAHGTAMGTGVALSGSGTLVLAGGGTATADPKQYVDLPDDLLNGLTNATFEAWVTWGTTTTNWQRIFDFGTTSTNTTGSYVFLSPRATTNGGCRVAITPLGASAELTTGGAQANGPVVASGMHHFVVVVDDTNDTVSLYMDGTLGTTVGFTGSGSVARTTPSIRILPVRSTSSVCTPSRSRSRKSARAARRVRTRRSSERYQPKRYSARTSTLMTVTPESTKM